MDLNGTIALVTGANRGLGARLVDGLLARDASLPAEQRVGVSLVLAQKPWLLRLFEAYRRARQDH